MYAQEQDNIVSRSQDDSQQCARHMGSGLLSLSFGMQDQIQCVLPQVHNTMHYSSSIVSRSWYFQKTTKMSTARYCIVKEHGFHTTVSGIKKQNKTQPCHPTTSKKNIEQSKELQKA